MDDMAILNGFKGWSEMSKLIASVNLVDVDTSRKFNEWKLKDGSKEGLMKIIEGGKKDA